MKYAITLFFILISPTRLLAAEQSTILSIPDMNCVICPITIIKSLKKVKGVKSVTVVYERKIAEVLYDDQQTNINDLLEATKNVGYPSSVIRDKE